MLIARPLILLFGSAELFMLALFGLSMVARAGRAKPAKGPRRLLRVGLLIGSIGAAPATGEFRMICDIEYLYDGIPLVIIGLGLFAIPGDLRPSAQEQHDRRGQCPREPVGSRACATGGQPASSSIRCAGIGCMIGAIPGLGGSVVDWIAYGHAVQTSQEDTSQFGKGDIRGVIAPESANNAMQGGALLPTMLFGIPGSGSMAVFLGGMVLIGIEPGPSMVAPISTSPIRSSGRWRWPTSWARASASCSPSRSRG